MAKLVVRIFMGPTFKIGTWEKLPLHFILATLGQWHDADESLKGLDFVKEITVFIGKS